MCDDILGMKHQTLESSYIKTNQQIEFWSEIIYWVIAKMSPLAFTLPKSTFSVFIHLTRNSGNVEAFELPFPMW